MAAAAPAAASASTVSAAHPASPSNLLVQVSAAPHLPAGARVIGAVAPTAQVSAAVAMRLPSQSAVTAFIDSTTNPRSSQYHRYLSRGQFTSRFGPSQAAVSAVEKQLGADGLRVTGVSANRLLVSFTGSAAVVNSAFHTGLNQVRLANGTMGRATTSTVRLPSSIAGKVQAVVGLDQLVHETDGPVGPIKARATGKTASPSVPAVPGGPVACSDALEQQLTGALTDQQLAYSYGVDPLYAAGDFGAGQTIDIYELEPYLTSDVQIFDQCYFGADHTSQITDTLVDGGAGTGPGSGEAALDIDNVSALAPGAKIHVFTGPNMNGEFGELDTWNQIAMADDARQISSSWGLCETAEQLGAPGTLQVENEIFEQTAAQGQTVYASAGDDGSDDCAGHASDSVATNLSLDDPASQPYVTSVGGTTVTDATEPPAETVWNNGESGGAAGGGISEAWAMPPWQSAAAVPQTPGATGTEACSNDPTGVADDFHLQGLGTTLTPGTPCRETPDVSALADPQTGYTIVYDGFWYQFGGTSASTPLWAALTAEMNASSTCSSLPQGLGFATPLFYQVASGSAADHAAAFSDVTVGDNDNLGVGSATDWSAGPGYDLASGLGTPRVTDANGTPGLAAQLCAAAAGQGATAPPQVSSLSQTSGSIAGGGTLTINGANFGSATGSVYFGTVDAQVATWTPTAVTIDVPAYQAPAGNPPGSAGRANITVVTAGTPAESSAPTANAVYDYTADSSGTPVVDYVSSENGNSAGGNTVNVVGSGFTGATAVHFGDVAATNLQVISDNELSVTVPASDGTCAVDPSQGLCAVAVTVTTPGGTSSGPAIKPAYQGPIVYGENAEFFAPAGCGCEIVPAPEEYDYASAANITSVSPQYASAFGDTVTITGSNFNLLTFEWANAGPAGQNFSQDFDIEGVTPTQLTIGVPGSELLPGTEPTASDISVQSANQLSNVSSFDYAGIPVVTGISKHLAPQADPGSLTITGHGLQDVNTVVVELQGDLDFLYSTSTAISGQSDTSLTVTLPSGFAAPADVLACSATSCSNPNPKVDTLTLAYPGRPSISAVGPHSGPAHGGTIVTIQGALDSELTAVHFGSAKARILSAPELTASGTIVVVAPPGTAGKKVSVTISTLGGELAVPAAPTSAANPAAVFTYAKSTPTAPRHVTGKAGAHSATIGWESPSDGGGSSVTGYVITVRAKHHKTITIKVSARTRKVTVGRLTAGTAWSFEVQAVNRYGRGLAATVTVRPKS